MRPDYCPVANEPCQAMCLDGCTLRKAKSENSLLREQVEQLTRQRNELLSALKESQANDRTGMHYLGQVRAAVGGNDFPDMVSRVEQLTRQRDELVAALESFGHKTGCRKNAFGDECTCGVDAAIASVKEAA